MTLWVFGYASLLWNPGFEVAESRPARLNGYHRSFCMKSIHHRGTPEDPGLVLALDAMEGASCDGLALAAREDVERYARAVPVDEVKENGFNLNIPRYVDTFEEEEEIDLMAVQAERKEIEAEITKLNEQMDGYLREFPEE